MATIAAAATAIHKFLRPGLPRLTTTTLLVTIIAVALYLANYHFACSRLRTLRSVYLLCGRVAISLIWIRVYNRLSKHKLKQMDLAIGIALAILPSSLFSDRAMLFFLLWFLWSAPKGIKYLMDETSIEGLWLQGCLGLLLPRTIEICGMYGDKWEVVQGLAANVGILVEIPLVCGVYAYQVGWVIEVYRLAWGIEGVE